MELRDTITIPDAPKSVYGEVREQIERMKTAVPGIIVTCTQVEDDALRITIALDKNTPQKYKDAVERFAAMVVEKIDKVLPIQRPPAEELSVVEKRAAGRVAAPGSVIEKRNNYELIRVNTPRIPGGISEKEKKERMKMQEILGRALDGLGRYLIGQKIYIKRTNVLNKTNKDHFQTYVNVDEDQAERAIPLLEEFIGNPALRGEKIDEEYSLVLELIAGEKQRFNLKLKKKSTPPNSTSS